MEQGTFHFGDSSTTKEYTIVVQPAGNIVPFDENNNELSFRTGHIEEEQETNDFYMEALTPFMIYNDLFRKPYRNGYIEVKSHLVEEDIVGHEDVFIHTVEGVHYPDGDRDNHTDFRMVALTFDSMEFVMELDAFDSESGEQIQFSNDLLNLKVLPRD